MLCDICGAKAVYLKKISGVAYCKNCFLRSVEERVRRTIGKKKLFAWDDRILLAVSGGKDSLVMMKIVSEIEADFPESSFFAVTVDEGIRSYREIGLRLASKYAKCLGVDHYVFSFKDFFGYTLSEIVDIAHKKNIPHHACTYCGVLRRKLLNVKGKELGATKIATAHNLDDECQTILMNLLRGDTDRLVRSIYSELYRQPGFVPRVKPMQLIPEKEITLYTYYSGIPLYSVDCPYSRTSLRSELRRFLNNFDAHHPGSKYALYSSFEKIVAKLSSTYTPIHLNRCKRCGEPTSSELCKACELLEELGL